MTKIAASLMLLLLHVAAIAQETATTKKCTVVLTYDDALDGHLDLVVPALDSLGLKATFYLTVSSPAFTKRLPEWKRVAGNNHELANHSVFHPCRGDLPGRSFVRPEYDLNNYTVQRITEELRQANKLLEEVDGKKERTFAYTCGDMLVNDTPFIDYVKKDFVAARGVSSEFIGRPVGDMYNLGAYAAMEHTGQQMINWVRTAMDKRATLVIIFHGVGGGHPINVTRAAHSELLHFLKKHEAEIATMTFLDAVKGLRE